VLAFGHGHFLRALALVFIEVEIRMASLLGLDTSSISVLELNERYGRRLLTWNWTPELAK
jgi:broad specificity phosphatase PhoE